MKTPTKDEIARALLAAGRVACNGQIKLAASEGDDAPPDRDELLRRAVARESVELEIEVLAYEQTPGDQNRKGVRVRDAAMASLARSGRGTPFMRDHDQGNSLAKSGEVVESKAFVDENGRRGVVQRVKLMEPTAVERALRGLMKSVSVGMSGGDVHCTACNASIFTKCYHLPLDVVEGDDGAKMTVEWEWQNPELWETSEVPIPAVPGAGVRGAVRAALGVTDENPHMGVATPKDAGSMGATDQGPQPPSEKKATMPDIKIPEDAVAAAQVLQAAEQLAQTQAELAIAQAEADRQLSELARVRADAAQAAQDKFILDAKVSGRITAVDEEAWRDLYAKNADRAAELMSRRPAGCSAPVGVGAQSTVVARRRKSPALAVAGNRWVSERQRRSVLKSGMTDEQYHAALAKYDEMHEGIDTEGN